MDDTFNIIDCKATNTGNDFITLPYPTIALELSSGKKEFDIPSLRTLFKLEIFLKLVIIINNVDITIDIITLHVPDTLSSDKLYLLK